MMFMVDVSNSFMVARNQHNWAPRNFTDDSPLASQVRLKSCFCRASSAMGSGAGTCRKATATVAESRAMPRQISGWRQATGTRSMRGSRVWSKLGRAGGLTIKHVKRIDKKEKNLGVKQIRINNFGFTVPTKTRVKLKNGGSTWFNIPDMMIATMIIN